MEKEMVNHPDHYQGDGGMEVIDAMVGVFGAARVADWCQLTAFKYLSRLGKKDDALQELGKANWYVQKQAELLKQIDTSPQYEVAHGDSSVNDWQ